MCQAQPHNTHARLQYKSSTHKCIKSNLDHEDANKVEVVEATKYARRHVNSFRVPNPLPWNRIGR